MNTTGKNIDWGHEMMDVVSELWGSVRRGKVTYKRMTLEEEETGHGKLELPWRRIILPEVEKVWEE